MTHAIPSSPDDAKRIAQDTYNAAADAYDSEPLAFWDRYGQRTIDRLRLRPGARVLDVCCGAGASALPAARAVGADGRVIAVDLAENLLQLARAKAGGAGLTQLEFRCGDMTTLGIPDATFDAVVCVFGIFFVRDMPAQVAELWRLVKSGGQLAVTTWGRDFWAPGYEIWLNAVREVRPDLHSSFRPWDRITTTEAVRELFSEAGIADVDVVGEDGHEPLRTPHDFWTIAMGSGLRWTIDQMDAATADAVRQEVVVGLQPAVSTAWRRT